MDPDRWEFANEWFLRGQKHLLKNITRRKHGGGGGGGGGGRNGHGHGHGYDHYGSHLDLEDDVMVMEIAKLKEEQKALDAELQGMNKRLETTEKRPQQMMAFLSNVVEDPQILSRILLERERKQQQLADNKKRRLIPPTTAASSSSSSGLAVTNSVKTEFEEDEATVGNVMSSSPETGFEIENSRREAAPPPDWWGQRRDGQQGYYGYYDCVAAPTPLTVVSPPAMGGAFLGWEDRESMGRVSIISEMAAENSSLPPCPFSLLEGYGVSTSSQY